MLAKLVAEGAAPKEISRAMRSLVSAVKVELMERHIALADVKLNRRADRLEDLVDDAERRAEERMQRRRAGAID